MSDTDKPSQRLHEMLTAVIKVQIENRPASLDEVIRKELSATLFSPKGKRARSGRADPGDAALMAGLQILAALEAAQKFRSNCDSLFRSRSLDRATKADWCRGLAWHYGYVLRNRATNFLKLVVKVLQPRGKGDKAVVALVKCYEEYKKETDDLYSERGKHTHTSQVDDPLIEQVLMLEMLLKDDELQVFRPIYDSQARKVRQHVTSASQRLLTHTIDASEAALGRVEDVLAAVFQHLESEARRVAAL